MGKTLQKMSRSNLTKTAVAFTGLASIALSTYLITSEFEIQKNGFQKEINELNSVLIEQEDVLEAYKIKEFGLTEDLKSYEMLTEEINERFVEVNNENADLKNENKKLKEEIKKDEKELEEIKKKSNEWISYKQTHYTSFCSTGCTGVTATGHDVSKNTKHNGYEIIAVDPSKIPLGSIVEIHDGDKNFKAIALDTGGAIKGKKVDLLVSVKDSKYAYSLGVKDIKLKVLRKGWG